MNMECLSSTSVHHVHVNQLYNVIVWATSDLS